MNKNWNRWLFASASVAMKNKASNDIVFQIEGQGERKNNDYAEFRMTGPIWRQRSPKLWYAEILVNVLIRVARDEKDFHKLFKLTGVVESCFLSCFPVRKYGDQLGDDKNVIIGYLNLLSKGDKDIETTNYGQVTSDVAVLQSTVEATYSTELSLD